MTNLNNALVYFYQQNTLYESYTGDLDLTFLAGQTLIITNNREAVIGTSSSETSQEITYATTVNSTPQIVGSIEDLTGVSQIDLTEVVFLTKSLCIGTDKLEFKPIDSQRKLTLIDSSILYIDGEIYDKKVYLDTKEKVYYYELVNKEKGNLSIEVIVNQGNKKVSKTINLEVKKCYTSEDQLNNLIEYIKDHSFIVILGVLLILFLGIISIVLNKS